MSLCVQPFFFFFFGNPCSPALTRGPVRSNGIPTPVVKVKTIQGSSQYGVLWIGTILDKFCLNFTEKSGLPSVVIINKKTEASRKLLNKKFSLTSQYFSSRRNSVNSLSIKHHPNHNKIACRDLIGSSVLNSKTKSTVILGLL